MSVRRLVLFPFMAGVALGGCDNEVYLGVEPLPSESLGGARGLGGTASGGGGTGGHGMGGQPFPTFGGPAVPCPADAIFCTGFEETDLLEEWTTWQRNGEVELESSDGLALSGARSLRTQLTADGENSRVVRTFADPIFSGFVSARVFFYVPSTMVIEEALVGIELKDDNSGGENKASINWGSDRSVRLVVTTGADPATSETDSDAYELDAWNCAVLRLEVGDTGAVEVELNGQTVLSAEGDTLPPDGVGQFLLGVLRSGPGEPIEFFYDDVSVATEALGCP